MPNYHADKTRQQPGNFDFWQIFDTAVRYSSASTEQDLEQQIYNLVQQLYGEITYISDNM